MGATAEEIDLLIDGGSIVTVDKDRRIIRDGAIAIRADRIVGVGKASELRKAFKANRVYQADNKCVTPGFVNAHIHLYHNIHKGLPAEALCGLPWSTVVHSQIATCLEPEHEIASALNVLMDCLRSGVTTFLDAGCYNVDAVIEAIAPLGMRGFVGRRSMDCVSHGHSALVDSTEICLRENERILKTFARGQDLIQPCVAIVGNGRCTDELIGSSKAMADRHGAILHMHHASHIENVSDSLMVHGRHPTEHLHDLGVLGPNVVLTHVLHATPVEIELLAQSRTNVAHCPSSAMKVIYGLAQFGRFPEMRAAGVNIALGTDPFDCSNDMLRVMCLAALTQKDYRLDPAAAIAEDILEMATINGARAVGRETEIGSIEIGKKADLAIFDTNRADWIPLHSEVRNLVYAASGDSCESVLVDGKFVLEEGRITTVDQDRLVHEIERLAIDLRKRSGLSPVSPWPFA